MAGPFFLAWVDASETVFLPVHVREDDDVFAFELAQDEGDFATLRLDVRNPRVGLLSPGRKTWAWLSWDRAYDPESPVPIDVVPLFFGRLVGVPTNIFAELVTLEFIARPSDYTTRKEAAAQALRTLPYFDPVWIAEDKRADPDVVLEARPQLWHIDRTTHAVSPSHILVGEDGIEDFSESQIFAGGGVVNLQLNNVPLRSVRIDAKCSWTQRGIATVNLGEYIARVYPRDPTMFGTLPSGCIVSFTHEGLVSNWPKDDAAIGDGWRVVRGGASPLDSWGVKNYSYNIENKAAYPEGLGAVFANDPSESESRFSASVDYFTLNGIGKPDFGSLFGPAGFGIPPDYRTTVPATLTDYKFDQQLDDEGELTSASSSSSYEATAVLPVRIAINLMVRAEPQNRKQHELISFTLGADVQPIVTLPGEDEIAALSIESADLADAIDGVAPIGSPAARRYLDTDRGKSSLEYLIGLARARLMMAARAVEITVPVPFLRLPGLTLRKSARIHDARLPGGVATGKIIGYRASLDGDTGRAECTVTLASAIGRDGTIDAIAGTPSYCEEAYTGADYQQYQGARFVLDGDVGFSIPTVPFADDGMFAGTLSVAQALSVPLTVQNGLGSKDAPTIIKFGLRPLNREFETQFPVTVTDLKIPKMIDLEAAA